MHMFTTPFPVPVPFPVPIPVPIFIPTSQKTYKGVMSYMKVMNLNFAYIIERNKLKFCSITWDREFYGSLFKIENNFNN